MERKTRRGRQARLAPETLEGRELMSVAALPAVGPGHHEHQHLHPTTPPPLRVPSARVPRPATPAIAVATSIPDANGFVSIIGHTYRKAKVRLALQSNGAIVQTIRADVNGWFGFNTTVGYGRTQLRLIETAPGHRRTSMVLPVDRVRPQANTAPGSPPTSNNSPGRSGSSQAGSQGGNLSTLEKIFLISSEYGDGTWAAEHALLQDGGYIFQDQGVI
jgi:hypothetical protein